MDRRLSLPLLAALVLAILAPDAGAAGLLIPRDGSPPIRVRSHRVTAVVTDGLARTTLRQTFVNPHARSLEAIYVFPLPEGAALVDVAMEADGQRLEGLLIERKRGRRIYDDIVRSKRDPALVEQIGRGKFRLSVFPVVPKKETVIEVTWIQHIPLSQGMFRYVYPLAIGGEAVATEQDLTVSVTFRSSAKLSHVVSPTMGMEIITRGEGEAVATLERVRTRLDEDVVIEAMVEVEKPTLAVTTFRGEDDEDGYFLAVVTPPLATEKDLIPRDVILVLDTSGSMRGEKMEQARASALYLLGNLRPADRVNVLRFSSSAEAFAAAPVPATPENLAKLRKFVEGFTAGGGTALGEALTTAVDVPEAPGRVRTVVLLTDGRPTIGETDPLKLVAMAKAGAAKGLKIFPFGVGEDLDSGLLGGIARAGRGRAEVFRPGGEIRSRLSAFLDRTSSPVLANVDLSIDGLRIHDAFPRPIPDAYLGEQVVIAGRYSGGGEKRVTASALRGGERVELATMAEFRTEPGGTRAVRELFARLKLDYLEEALRLRTGLADDAYFAALDRGAYSTAGEIVQEIIEVSLATAVQSAYTSFLVLLPEDRARIDPRDAEQLTAALDRVRKARGLPEEPVFRMGGDHNETDNDLPFAESLGGRDFNEEGLGGRDLNTDAPFEGPSAGSAIGIGGGGGIAGRGGVRHLRASGGGVATEPPVDSALEWLMKHQHADGYWEDGGSRVRTTGLALLAFFGAGETHRYGRYRRAVRAGLKYLKQMQDLGGRFGDRKADGHLADHAVAALAMCESYALTGSPLFKPSAQMAIDYLLSKGTEHDPATRTKMAMVFKSAKAAGLRVDSAAMKALVFVAPEGRNDLAAAEILCRIFAGEDPRKSLDIEKATDRVLSNLPSRDGKADLLAWYLGTLAMFQVGGESWKAWSAKIKVVVLDRQRKDGDDKGSWDPVGAGADRLGRTGATALMEMCMEVYYRYARVFGVK